MIEPAGSRDSRRRRNGAPPAQLDAWDRYGRILAAQLAALDAPAPDLERFHELADEREAVAREIDALDPDSGEHDAKSVDPSLRDRLQAIGATDRAVLQKLGALGGEVGRAVKDMDDRRPGRMGYLAGSTPSTGRSVDVTS